jgi:protein-S-isoprenylcysteine O-methyltransferase Ste14
MQKGRVTTLYLVDLLSVVFIGVALFWSAGRVTWWPAWAAIAVWLGSFLATDVLLLRSTPGLLAERMRPPQGAKQWDRILVSALRLMEFVRYLLAGFDRRYSWTGDFPPGLQIAALAVCVIGQALFVWAMASNAYFSQVVRIQSDRGHTVISNGPYRLVRHPGYAGMILFELAVSTLLGSWPAILAGGICTILLTLRTAIEDRTLQVELPGYADYARQIRQRLIPGIW